MASAVTLASSRVSIPLPLKFLSGLWKYYFNFLCQIANVQSWHSPVWDQSQWLVVTLAHALPMPVRMDIMLWVSRVVYARPMATGRVPSQPASRTVSEANIKYLKLPSVVLTNPFIFLSLLSEAAADWSRPQLGFARAGDIWLGLNSAIPLPHRLCDQWISTRQVLGHR